MNLPPPRPRRFVPKELIVEVLSFLSVKSMMRMRCLGKSYNSLFIDPYFVKMHLQRSAQNPHLVLVTTKIHRVIPLPLHRLLDNHSISLDEVAHNLIVDDSEGSKVRSFVGSCNGLICFLTYTFSLGYQDVWLIFENPSTRTRSGKLGHLHLLSDKYYGPIYYEYAFGYDNLTSTYKVVMLSYHRKDNMTVETKVFSLGDNIWRNIPNLPAIPLQLSILHPHQQHNVVYLSGTLNWLAVFDFPIDSVHKYVIISLDLGTETYTQMRLPQGFDELPQVFPTICVLNGSLSFSYDAKRTHVVLWHMTNFGVEDSWTPLLQISYESYQIGGPIFYLVPLHLSEYGQTLIFVSNLRDRAFLYNTRNNCVERARIPSTICWFRAMDYVESLVSIC